jgi:hypothetical protein
MTSNDKIDDWWLDADALSDDWVKTQWQFECFTSYTVVFQSLLLCIQSLSCIVIDCSHTWLTPDRTSVLSSYMRLVDWYLHLLLGLYTFNKEVVMNEGPHDASIVNPEDDSKIEGGKKLRQLLNCLMIWQFFFAPLASDRELCNPKLLLPIDVLQSGDTTEKINCCFQQLLKAESYEAICKASAFTLTKMQTQNRVNHAETKCTVSWKSRVSQFFTHGCAPVLKNRKNGEN